MGYLLCWNYSLRHTHKQWAPIPWAVQTQLFASPHSLDFYTIHCNQWRTMISTILKAPTAPLCALLKQTVMWYQISSSKLVSTAVTGTRSTAAPAGWDWGAKSCVCAQPTQMPTPIYPQGATRASSLLVHQIPFASKVHEGTEPSGTQT